MELITAFETWVVVTFSGSTVDPINDHCNIRQGTETLAIHSWPLSSLVLSTLAGEPKYENTVFGALVRLFGQTRHDENQYFELLSSHGSLPSCKNEKPITTKNRKRNWFREDIRIISRQTFAWVLKTYSKNQKLYKIFWLIPIFYHSSSQKKIEQLKDTLKAYFW